MLRSMTAVIHDDVQRGDLLPNPGPEGRVPLIAYQDFRSFSPICTTGVFDIDAVNPCLRPEVVAPHTQASAAVNADLQDVHRQTTELRQMALIGIEIGSPLPDAWALPVCVEP